MTTNPIAGNPAGDSPAAGVAAIPCCPPLEACDCCDRLDFRYQLPFRPAISVDQRRQVIPVEVTLVFRYERCPGPMSLGDLVYSNTLLPGEKVRLFTSDRHSRFFLDSDSQLSYRHETTSEESYYSAGFASSLSQLSLLETGAQSSSFHSSSVGGGGGAGLDLGFFSIGGSVSASSYDANAASAFAHSLTQFAASSASHMEAGRGQQLPPRSEKFPRAAAVPANLRISTNPLRAPSPIPTIATPSPSSSTGSTSVRRSPSAWWPSSGGWLIRRRRLAPC